jgi:hypothetical protein
LAVLILAAIIFFVFRNLQNSPNRVMAKAMATPQGDAERAQAKNAEFLAGYANQQNGKGPRKPLPKDKPDTLIVDNGPPMLSLFVEDQNTNIGRRNIHVAKAGAHFSVGGGKSDFLIFLVPLPPGIAEVQFDGRQCTFIPRKAQYFPDIGAQTVPNCVGKTIRVISDKNYELHIRIERYEDPLLALNRLLHSVDLPEPVV